MAEQSIDGHQNIQCAEVADVTSNCFPSTNCKPAPQEELIVNLYKLKEKPRKIVQIDFDHSIMAHNEQYLLYFPQGKVSLIDVQGKEQLTLNRNFPVFDVCWSLYLDQFLIFSPREIYSLERQIENEKLVEFMKFDEDVSSGTCFDQTLVVCIHGRVIEVYSMQQPNPKLLQRFEPPSTIDRESKGSITDLKFNSNGSYLAVAITGVTKGQHQLQLRSPTDLKVLHILDLELGFYRVHPLPNNEYLVHSSFGNELFLVNADAKIKQKTRFDRLFESVSLFGNEKCLAVQAFHLATFSAEMRFYDM